jgi:hypothetical protein
LCAEKDLSYGKKSVDAKNYKAYFGYFAPYYLLNKDTKHGNHREQSEELHSNGDIRIGNTLIYIPVSCYGINGY